MRYRIQFHIMTNWSYPRFAPANLKVTINVNMLRISL